jgi:hypothetical protein
MGRQEHFPLTLREHFELSAHPLCNTVLLLQYKNVGRRVLAVIKCIYLSPTHLYFIQDIEDRCLLLTSSVSFVDLPFQEHQMMEKHHMDQNPCISSYCPKQGIVTDNITRGNDMAQSTGSTDPRCARPATSPWLAGHVLPQFQNPFCLRV